MTPGSTPPVDAAPPLVRLVRDEGRAVLATLTRILGDLSLAEDAVQEALVRALETWPRDGVPANPRAWLITTARRRALDRIRRESTRGGREIEAVRMLEDIPDPSDGDDIGDDQLRLIFTCCHPSLSPETRVALSLRTLCGLSVNEVARALLITEAALAKRLTRARRKIAVAGIPYRVPAAHELPDRLASVEATAYLVFNEGYAATDHEDHIRAELSGEAIRLARLLLALMPDEASLEGLLALMLLHDARREARVDADGGLTLLADQDRSQWDHRAIQEGVRLVGSGLRRTADRPDPYVTQAAIAACHALAPTAADTDWSAIVSWYDVLVTVQDTPIVRLNRAAAIAQVDGPQVALDLIDAIPGLDGYPTWHSVRAELLALLSRPVEAVEALDAALASPLTHPQRELLTHRRDQLRN